ncbi:MAG: hypothetical protein ACJAR5_003479 [Pseudophaeobacter arcticus]|jgi:hypothetical protein
MPNIPFQLSEDWASGNRFSAADETGALLTNTASGTVYSEITDTYALPAIYSRHATPLHPGHSIPLELKAGWRPWFCGAIARVT